MTEVGIADVGGELLGGDFFFGSGDGLGFWGGHGGGFRLREAGFSGGFTGSVLGGTAFFTVHHKRVFPFGFAMKKARSRG